MARFLADECVWLALVKALRGAGHDVISAAEVAPGMTDAAVLATSVRRRQILITEDADFGRLVFAGGHQAEGIVVVRFAQLRGSRPDVVRAIVERQTEAESRLVGHLTEIEADGIRQRRLPRRPSE